MIKIDNNITDVKKPVFFFNQIKIYDYEMSLNTKFYKNLNLVNTQKLNIVMYWFIINAFTSVYIYYFINLLNTFLDK